MTLEAPVLEFEHVTATHAGATAAALRDVSFVVRPGEFVVLAGASGSGKSTVLHAACGLLPHHVGGVLQGHVRVTGRDTREATPSTLAAVVGTVLQDPETQVVMNVVRAELSLPLQLRGEDESTVALAVEEVALALGIEGLLDRRTSALSGGELQRVALGAALVAGARGGPSGGLRLFLLDEPTAQLDPVAGDELVWLLRRLNEEHGTAVVLAEHRLDRCLHHADRVVVLQDGRVACDAVPAAFLDWAADADPALLPPAARLFRAAGRRPLPVGVRDARQALTGPGRGRHGPDAATPPDRAVGGGTGLSRRPGRRTPPTGSAARVRGVWREIADGPVVLRGVDLDLRPGERVALMGRNGAGKSSLLRVLADLDRPTRGRVERAGPVRLLPQHPGDVLLHDRVGDETTPAALELVGLDHLADRHPRDLSGGQRQRLALAVVLAGGAPPAILGLDEPTRGMDARARAALLRELQRLSATGTTLVVATHDVEFAAELADRVVLLGGGRVIADGPPAALLGQGWYFATQTARILERPDLLTPEAGARAMLGGARADGPLPAADTGARAGSAHPDPPRSPEPAAPDRTPR
ncbi:ABC transporter ATP-binding protein [Patulibacter sp.]|uniref:ABC transporter ATP-binding protein n=1 Tax=Patulibacter sp. TaxID=1912859 RepID=UPI00271FBFDE|nr:ATP-binding cassette domain-containing protein [Patulibacter sp.]MDO9409033.1 ATP-binding cassette domain-containing protein [Patulibacter sp.]